MRADNTHERDSEVNCVYRSERLYCGRLGAAQRDLGPKHSYLWDCRLGCSRRHGGGIYGVHDHELSTRWVCLPRRPYIFSCAAMLPVRQRRDHKARTHFLVCPQSCSLAAITIIRYSSCLFVWSATLSVPHLPSIWISNFPPRLATQLLLHTHTHTHAPFPDVNMLQKQTYQRMGCPKDRLWLPLLALAMVWARFSWALPSMTSSST